MLSKGSHGQRVLTLPKEQVADLFLRARFYPHDDRVEEIIHNAEWNGKFVDRDYAESTEAVKQIIPYTLIRNERKILVLRRSKKSKRDSLRLKHTILVGGHVDDFYDEPGNRLIKCLYRELSEELNIIPKSKPKLLGLVVDPTTDVGRHHLGVIFDTEIENKKVFLLRKQDTAEFTGSNKNYTAKLSEIETFLNNLNSFDNWSALFLRSHASNFLFEPKTRREISLGEYGF